jgi:hypothetical protein
MKPGDPVNKTTIGIDASSLPACTRYKALANAGGAEVKE